MILWATATWADVLIAFAVPLNSLLLLLSLLARRDRKRIAEDLAVVQRDARSAADESTHAATAAAAASEAAVAATRISKEAGQVLREMRPLSDDGRNDAR